MSNIGGMNVYFRNWNDFDSLLKVKTEDIPDLIAMCVPGANPDDSREGKVREVVKGVYGPDSVGEGRVSEGK